MSKKKKYWLIILATILVGIIITIIGAGSALAALGLLLILIGVVMIFIFSRKLRGICRKCGMPMKGANYSYEETGRSTDSSGNRTANIIFEAECPNCSHVKKFQKGFSVSPNTNLERNVRKYAEKYFE